MYSKIIAKSKNGNPIVATLKGILDIPEEKKASLIYVTAEMIGGAMYDQKQATLDVAQVKGRPAIIGRAAVTIPHPEGDIHDEAIPDVPAVPDQDNYAILKSMYSTGEQYTWALQFIERNHNG